MADRTNLRLFLDSNVIISGLFSLQGPPGKILSLHSNSRISIVVCQIVLEEVVNTIREKKPEVLSELQSLLTSAPPEIIQDPPVEEIRRWTKYLHFEDAVILSAAISAEPDYFVTGDNHFYTGESLSEKSGLHIITPAEIVKLLEL